MRIHGLALLACWSLLAGCGGGGTGADLASGGDLSARGGGDLAAAVTDGAAPDGGATDAAPGGGDMASSARHEDIKVSGDSSSCFVLASGQLSQDNPCPGDVVFLTGAKVDLQSADGQGAAFCQLNGTFMSFGDVPSDYSKCAWMPYVEGGAGLANAGLIVRDRAGAHHYRWRVVSNELPKIVFDYAAID